MSDSSFPWTNFDQATFINAGRDVNFTCNWVGQGNDSSLLRDNARNRTLARAKKQGFEEIAFGKVHVQKDVSSKVLVVRVKSKNPFEPPSTLEITRTVQFAEISGKRTKGKCTMVSFESTPGKATLPQLFGLCRSKNPALIFHEELVGGEEIIDQHAEAPIIYAYLWYRHVTSYRAISRDGVLMKGTNHAIPVSRYQLSEQYGDWFFNTRTCSWVYDIGSITQLCDPVVGAASVFFEDPPSLDCNPQLDPKAILRHVPDYLQLVATLKDKINVEGLKGSLPMQGQRFLTFGAVVDPANTGILAHFSPIQSPRWYHRSMNTEMHASYSKSAPSRLNLHFVKRRESVRLNMRFSLRISPADRHKLRVAYLTQWSSLKRDDIKRSDLVFIEEIRFKFAGNLTCDPSKHQPPIYLFVPPPILSWVNGVPFIEWPMTAPFFYWSFDPNGKDPIPKADWQQYKIPVLKVKDVWVGSSWPEKLYKAAEHYLSLKNYGIQGGEQYTIERGLPILIKGKNAELFHGTHTPRFEHQYRAFRFMKENGYEGSKIQVLQRIKDDSNHPKSTRMYQYQYEHRYILGTELRTF
ncbi:hypothetical protein L218DRAFT_949405 [Marasmius fiardii PR-910]|nr:hypothetical protein L218DRAFT_949405 [Marasmius fiardii PR-910]